MNNKRLWISAGIIAFVVLVVFVFSAPHTRDLGVKPSSLATENVPAVALHDSFKKGLHTITGSLVVTNACTVVSASASLTTDVSDTESILVAISTLSDSGICLQQPTRVDFKTTVSASANLPITATVNGSSASTTPS